MEAESPRPRLPPQFVREGRRKPPLAPRPILSSRQSSRRVGYPVGKGFVAQARYRAAARIVANSKWVAERAAASGVPREQIEVVYEGAEIPPPFTAEQRQNARARWGISQSTKLLGCVGV